MKIGDIDECTEEELKQKVVNTGATFDGSWSSRGWSARDGVVAAISVVTGKVVDVEYLTGSCSRCTEMEMKRINGSISRMQFLEWYIEHDENCYMNHNGSAPAMEAEGAVRIYKRSVEKRKLRYIPFVGDGDSKAYSSVQQAVPYGPAFFIDKQDCIAHVTKRMGTNLRALITKNKGKKLADGKGLGGKGRLTLTRIDTIQNFYGKAIRDNKGNSEGMASATRAILKHYSSTKDQPQHEDCPKGDNSWCSFQRDISKKINLHKTIKDPLPPAVVEAVQPVFNKLGDKAFLAGCERCLTQNANESLHHVIWGIAPKEQYTSQVETYLAVCLGVLTFNAGIESLYSKLLPAVGIPLTPSMVSSWQKIDHDRVVMGDYKERTEVKERRKRRKRLKTNKQDAFVHQEGTTYCSQSFFTTHGPSDI